MTAKQNKSTSSRGKQPDAEPRADFVGYVNISLTDRDKAEYDKWLGIEGASEHALSRAFGDGYQFSLKFNARTDSYTCSISRWHPEQPDAGLIYTAHAGQPFTALSKAVWVWSVKLKADLQNGYVKREAADVW